MAKLSGITTPSLTFDEGAAPSTPSASDVIVYAKADGLMYSKDDAGTETLMSSGPASAAAFVGARAYNNALQTIAHNSFTAVTLNTEYFDTDGFHDTGSNTSRMTIPTGKGGKYLISATCTFANNATGQRQLRIRLNNTSYLPGPVVVPVNSGTYITGMALNFVYALAATDYIEMFVYQDSGGNLDTSGDATAYSSLGVTLLGT